MSPLRKVANHPLVELASQRLPVLVGQIARRYDDRTQRLWSAVSFRVLDRRVFAVPCHSPSIPLSTEGRSDDPQRAGCDTGGPWTEVLVT